jgi:sugar lactone lactonase YvrE
MNRVFLKSIFAAFTLGVVAQAQNAPPAAPPLLPCGVQADAEILCGTKSPEDLELTPDGKYLITGEFLGAGRAGSVTAGASLDLFDIAGKTFHKLAITNEPNKEWGDPTCPGPVGEAMVPHGISLAKRANGAMQLYVVNHGGRESIEMFELKKDGAGWALVWHGCVVSSQAFNDVAVLRDGSFAATHPTAMRGPGDTSDLFAGKPSGWVSLWVPGKGETELPGTRAGYPNGVLVSADGRTMYFNAWTAKEVHKYDLKTQKETGVVKLDFMPDNITWTSQGKMLAAGVKGARGVCGSAPCIQSFGIAEVDPADMKARTVFDSEGKGALIGGVSVALAVKNSIYIGSFQGDRIVRIDWKSRK